MRPIFALMTAMVLAGCQPSSPQSAIKKETAEAPKKYCSVTLAQELINGADPHSGGVMVALENIPVEVDGTMISVRPDGVFEWARNPDSAPKITDLNVTYLNGDESTMQRADFAKFEILTRIQEYSNGDRFLEATLNVVPNAPNSPVGVLIASSRNQFQVEASLLLNRTKDHEPSAVEFRMFCFDEPLDLPDEGNEQPIEEELPPPT